MKRFIYFFCFLFIGFCSCETKKQAIDIVAEDKTEGLNSNKLKELGFVKGSIKDFSNDDGCGYLIVLEENKQILNPLGKLDLRFQKNGLKIWLKYRPIRPTAPACKKGIPIDLEEVKID